MANVILVYCQTKLKYRPNWRHNLLLYKRWSWVS